MTEQESKRWYAGITRYQWIVLIIASLGWVFDIFEGQIFVAAMNEAMPELTGKDKPPALYQNIILAAFLLGGALGGILFGMLSDRIGRRKTLSITILIYSMFTCFSAFAQTWWQMAGLRFLMAIGVGGEWAVASTLVAEVFPKRARAWAQSIFHASSVLGTYLAVLAGTFVIANHNLNFTFTTFGQTWHLTSWRIAFLLGVIPALLIVWVRISVRESEKWEQAKADAVSGEGRKTGRIGDLFSANLIRHTMVGVTLAAVGLATFWGVHIYGKDLLRREYEAPHLQSLPNDADEDAKKAALKPYKDEIKRGEMLGMFLVTTGGGLGLVLFGVISERLGRRGAFLLFHLGGVISTLILFQFVSGFTLLCVLLPVFGFFTLGMHAGYAVYFPELFPTHLRGTGTGFCFNAGRILAAPMLLLRGAVRDAGLSLDDAVSLLSLLYLLVVVILPFAPETRGKDLPE